MGCKCSCGCDKPKAATSKQTALWIGGVVLALVLLALVYSRLAAFSEWLVSQLPLEQTGRLHEAAVFFFYDTPKVFLLLMVVVFFMGIVRSFFSPARTRALLVGKREGLGNIAAAGLGIVTPFCTCSAVPLFIGFTSAGVPLGVAFSFLISSPMVNEVALGLLWGLVGWKVALAYLVFGLGVSIFAGWAIGRFHLEGWLEEWVRKGRSEIAEDSADQATVSGRIRSGLCAVQDIVGKVWPWVIAGIAVGAFIHGYAPTELLASVMGKQAWWSVPVSVLIGVPLYSNAAGIIPIVEALWEKGAALGTVLAFMMSVTALSLPEMILLRKVLRPRLIAVFFGVVACGIIAVGYLFNAFFV